MTSLTQRARSRAGLIRRYANWRDISRTQAQGIAPERVHIRGGPVIHAPPDAPLLLEMTEEVFFTERYTRAAGFAISRTDTVVDIGANLGVFSMYAAQRTSGPVYAYEPFPENVQFLERNIEANRAGNVQAIPEAMSGSTGTARLYISPTCGGNLLFHQDITGPLSGYVDVPTATLADVLDRHGLERIDFLKMDCEGSEGAILAAARRVS